MLGRALPYQAAFACTRWMERSTSTFPDLPTDEEWSRIEKIYDLLQPFDEITTIISGTKYHTANLYLKNVWKIKNLLSLWSFCEDVIFRSMATKMRGKFKDYWNNYSMILSFAAILDHRFKFQLIMYCFQTLDPETSELKSKIVKDQLYKLFGEYVKDKPQANVSGAKRGKDDLVVCSLNLIYIVYVFFINKSYLICLYVLICVFDLCRDLQILIILWYLVAEFQNWIRIWMSIDWITLWT